MCSSSGGDQAARAAGRCSFPESVKMRDTAGRAASDEHELQIWICLDIDNERRPRSSATPLLPSVWGRQSALLLSPPTVLFHFFCLHCPLYAASKQSREDLAFFNAMRFFCLKKAQAKQEFVFLNTIFLLKRNQSSNQSSRQQDHQEGKAATAAAAKAAGERKRRTSSGRTWAG